MRTHRHLIANQYVKFVTISLSIVNITPLVCQCRRKHCISYRIRCVVVQIIIFIQLLGIHFVYILNRYVYVFVRLGLPDPAIVHLDLVHCIICTLKLHILITVYMCEVVN